jgi:hypothetical protein
VSYRTKRPATRSLLVFGVGVTLAITQLGAGCVPPHTADRTCEGDAAPDDSGRCDGKSTTGEGGDAK